MPRNYSTQGKGTLYVGLTKIQLELGLGGEIKVQYEEQQSVTLDDDTAVYTKEPAVVRSFTIPSGQMAAPVPRIQNAKTGTVSGTTTGQIAFEHLLSLVRADQLALEAGETAAWLAPSK